MNKPPIRNDNVEILLAFLNELLLEDKDPPFNLYELALACHIYACQQQIMHDFEINTTIVPKKDMLCNIDFENPVKREDLIKKD